VRIVAGQTFFKEPARTGKQTVASHLGLAEGISSEKMQ
jgi:hypothetical protein